MKVLITGSNGQLGYDVGRHLSFNNIEYLGTNRESLDITDGDAVIRLISDYNPDVVIHCAAYTAVDNAETERALCYAVNAIGTKFVAEACKEIDAKMVYISSDYVFDGEGNQPFEVTDKPNPINYYGRTKYEGELEVQKKLQKFFIVRTSWVFGRNGNNFVNTMLRLGKEKDQISVVSDQIGSPTYTDDLANLIVKLVVTDKYGIYHLTNEGYCSWYEFACEIFKQARINVTVNPIKSEDYPTKAIRPLNSRLSKENMNFGDLTKMQNWKDALKEYIRG